MFSMLRRVVPIVAGLLLLSLFIWFAGPYFAFADFRPLEPATARGVLILVVVAVWAAKRPLRRFRASRASDRLMAAVVKQSKTESRPSADAVQLRERFEEAAAILKKNRRGDHSLYDLPWYVFIGAPGSGKTTALINSGLKFPLEQRVGKGALRGVGGTRSCDWWFTDQAVFLDTAGRFTTQDSDAASDSAAWKEFLALLMKYRKRRPLNGVILSLSAEDLMVQSEASRESQIAAIRRRLDELHRELHTRLPVYVVVTKCDLVAGFQEYFDDLSAEGRAQVWGVTFPYEQTAGGDAPRMLPQEFDDLMRRLNERVLARLDDEHDLPRRTRVLAFPQQMAALRDPLAQVVAEVFAATRFDQQPLLRGVYLTSGTQDGTPIDRLLSSLGRRFSIAPESVAKSAGRGKAYFIERLLKDVLINEAGLASVSRRQELRQAAAQLGAYAAMVVVALLGLLLLFISYGRNRAYIDSVAQQIATLQSLPASASSTSLDALLPRLDAVRTIAEVANVHRSNRPLLMQWGLFQGASFGEAANDAYRRELDGALLARVAARFEQRLIDLAAEPDALYEYLKGYLMLGEPARLDKAHLGFLADLEWRSAYPGNPELAESIAKHFRSLLDSGDRLQPVTLDQSLVARARASIRQASIPRLIYNRIKLTHGDDPARALRLDVAMGVGADRVLKRKSGASLAEPVPAIYTADVFKEVTSKGTEEVTRQFAADAWVWGDASFSLKDSAALTTEVFTLYEDDYIQEWDGLLTDVELGSSLNTTEALAIIAAPTSPLRGLLQVVSAHTALAKPAEPAPGGAIASTQKALERLLKQGKEAVGISGGTPGVKVTTHFAPIHALLAGAPGSAPIDRVLAQIGQIQRQLLESGAGAGQTSRLDASANAQLNLQTRLLRQDAATLPPAVRGLIDQLASRTSGTVITGASDELAARYRLLVAECNTIIGGRYPFSLASAVEVPVDDFGRLFGYGGVFDAFFSANLEPLIDVARTPWAWRQGSVALSPSIPRQFEAARSVRDAFFRPGSLKPELQFTIAFTYLDAASTRVAIEMDGQVADYRHGPERSVPVAWPGPKPGVAAVSFEGRDGARPHRSFEGSWGWFRLVEFGQLQRETDVRFGLRFDMGGHEARARLESTTIRNPFARREWLQFRCGS
jgi:type VI secretion system protein ImpL